MGDLGKTMLAGDRGRPAFDGRTLHLDGAAAMATHEVVVMSARASAIDRLAVVASERVDLPVLGQQLHRPVDGGQADRLAPLRQQVVQLLGGAEVVDR